MSLKPRFAPAALGLALASAPVLAEPPEPPPYYAVRDARVVTVSGGVLERATVLLADGLIEAIGPDLEIPPDAWVVEAKGLVLYPGLIDAFTTLGQKRHDPPAPALPPAPGAPGAPQGPQARPGTTPWQNAADDLDNQDARIETWRKAGFTTVVTAPEGGIFPGEAAVIDLASDEDRGAWVVATPVAQRLVLDGAGDFRTFPSSLMGVFAYVKQVLSDAQHYEIARTLYQESPRGRERPAYDRTLEPLHRAMSTGLPVLLPATHGREIDRALALADEYGLNAILLGGQGAYERAAKLAVAAVPVLVSLDWPAAEPDRDPDVDTPLRELYYRAMAPSTPRRLWEANVPFAFTSLGLASPAEIFEGVRKAQAAGLPGEVALASLTLDAAEILGLADRLGSVEVGKIANLVLATAEPWTEGAEVRAVFVDGRKYEAPVDSEAAEPPSVDVTGTWTLHVASPEGEREVTARLKMSKDGTVTGETSSERGTMTIRTGRLSGQTLELTASSTGGERSFEVTYRAAVASQGEDQGLTGTVTVAGRSLELRGERTAGPAAGPSASASTAPAVPEAELEEIWRRYQGPVRRFETLLIVNATVHPVSGPTLEGSDVLIREGKIAALGRNLDVPTDAEVIDAQGQHLIPGIIDAHSHIAVEGGVNEGSLAVTAMVGTEDVLDPDDVSIYRALAGGVTTANVLHGSANPIGGKNATIKLRWGSDARGLKFAGAPPGIKFALGENPKRSRSAPGGFPQRYPATRMGVMDVIRDAFTRAQIYRQDWTRYERQVAAGERPMPPRVDLELQPLAEILEGKRLVHAHCYRADEILQLLRLAEELGFRIATLQHVLEGYKVADEIAAHGAGASTFSDWWGYKVEAYDAIPYNAALMTERGVVVSINSDSAEEMRHLNQEAAKTMKWGGLDETQALALVTLNPARQLGIAERVGSIEVGKDADLVLYNEHPLSLYAVVQKTFVDGDLYFDREADRERQAILDATKARLLGNAADEPDDSQEQEETPAAPTEVPSSTTPVTPRVQGVSP